MWKSNTYMTSHRSAPHPRVRANPDFHLKMATRASFNPLTKWISYSACPFARYPASSSHIWKATCVLKFILPSLKLSVKSYLILPWGATLNFKLQCFVKVGLETQVYNQAIKTTSGFIFASLLIAFVCTIDVRWAGFGVEYPQIPGPELKSRCHLAFPGGPRGYWKGTILLQPK